MNKNIETGDQKLKIGISACLMGDEVRFNAGHCRYRFVTDTLSDYATFRKVCPETAIGLPVPRETMRLEKDADDIIHMVAPKSGLDHTTSMTNFAQDWTGSMHKLDLDGFIFKKDSPSCGVFRVKVYRNGQPAERRGTGLFADAVQKANPDLPVEEEGRLSDPVLRENFIERLFAYRRVKDLFAQDWARKDVVEFHSKEKLLLMAHSPEGYKELGRMVAAIADYEPDAFETTYTTAFMAAMNTKSSKGRHTNALMHMAGYLKKQLSPEGREELNGSIQDYYNGIVPLAVPVTLLRHMLRRFDENYLLQQSYLAPTPHELALRSHV